MKSKTILNCLMLLIPIDALAHPGHAALAGLSSGQLLTLSALAGAGLLYAALRLYRRRTSMRADD